MNQERRSVSTATIPPRRTYPLAYVIAGGLVAGTLDIVFATVFWGLKADVPGQRILQSVASGLFGPAAFEGGLKTASLGLLLHYVIAICMALALYVVAKRWPMARDLPVRAGAIYGVFLYLVMNLVVVPLSAARPGSRDPVWIGLSVAVHMLLIGIPIALFVRQGLAEAEPDLPGARSSPVR
jgi:uncharacterized membrane protein YagU involved in acid resistance